MGIRLDMIGIFVSDLQQMVRFYRDVLGFEIDWDGQGPYPDELIFYKKNKAGYDERIYTQSAAMGGGAS